MKMELPFPVLHSLFLLNQAGHEAFVVGGSVRDALMDKAPTDWDITTSALPEETLSVFAQFRTIETGIRHGTVTVIIEDTPLEITTYRIDGDYSDGRHPDTVSFTRSVKEDLKRRDFTINAMAYHPQIGLVDPFHGQRDLKNKVIRCVGNSQKRFAEDALRILRGLRFAATLGFSIHPFTARAIHKLGDTLSCVAIERISAEFCKLICGQQKGQILREYADVFKVFLPNIDYNNVSVSETIDDLVINLASLMVNLSPEESKEACKRLRLSNRVTEDVVVLVRWRDFTIERTQSGVLHTLHLLGPELTRKFLCLQAIINGTDYDWFYELWARIERDGVCCYRVKDLKITGEDLIAAGIPAGPAVGDALIRLLNAVMDGECFNEKNSLLEYVIKKPVQ